MEDSYKIKFPIEDSDYYNYVISSKGWTVIVVTFKELEYEVILYDENSLNEALIWFLKKDGFMSLTNVVVVEKLNVEVVRNVIASLIESGQVLSFKPRIPSV